jgi:hypothetical protein
VAARNLNAFEILVGPYAMAHLRVTQDIRDHGGELTDDGVHVYPTESFESPLAESSKDTQYWLSYLHKPLADEHRRAGRGAGARTPRPDADEDEPIQPGLYDA